MKTRLVSVVLALVGGSAVAFGQSAQPKIVEHVVGPAYTPGTIYTLSARGMHLATMQPKGNKFSVTIDGVEGEEFDQIVLAVPTFEIDYDPTGVIRGQTVARRAAVALSPDGRRYAYAGVRGDDVILIVDGKEVFRAPYSLPTPPVSLLQFSPDGQHYFFYSRTSDTMQSSRLMWDGKPVGPPFDGTPQPRFSADGSRWLLSAGHAKAPAELFLLIDGKDAGYAGQRVRFSPDGKHVVCTTGNDREQKLLVDGKPILTAPFIERFVISPTNDILTIVRPSAGTGDVFKQSLYFNGKLVPGSEGVAEASFSPDGKHWAARLQRDMATVMWVMHDGKKQADYSKVEHLTFSPDSTTLAYLATAGQKQFMVTNGQADEGNELIRSRPTFAQQGNKFAYAAGQQPLALKIYHDGKASPVLRNVFGLVLSPDGTRTAYFAGLDAMTTEFIVDGKAVTRDGGFGGTAVFSPDSKHVAAGTRKPQGYATIFFDGDFLPERQAMGVPREFTPDSQHLIVVGGGADKPGVGFRYFLDGDLVAEFSGRSMPFENSPKMRRDPAVGTAMAWGVNSFTPDPEVKPWEYQPDGTIVWIGPAVDPTGSGPMKKITVTPAPGTSVATWFAAAKASEAKAIADAEAAKAKAEADKAAAAAERKAAADAAAAKRKADYDAAVAAKAKARQDALDAKAKAAAERKK